MIDTHAHLYGEEFSDDFAAVVERARAAGVEQVFLPNIDAQSITPMLDLCDRWRGYFYPMMGLHPTEVREDYVAVLQHMEQALQADDRYIGVGEVGLDYYWDTTYAAEQRDAFVRQVEWACRYRLPLMIHCRAAHDDLVRLLEPYRREGLRGVFHCFDGDEDQARALLSFDGFMLGVNGVMTFKKSRLPAVLRTVPLDRLVLETDAPYLAPVPVRGARNESAYMVHTLRCLASVLGETPEEVDQRTTRNALAVFARASKT